MKSHVVKSDDYITLHGIRYVKLERAGGFNKMWSWILQRQFLYINN